MTWPDPPVIDEETARLESLLAADPVPAVRPSQAAPQQLDWAEFWLADRETVRYLADPIVAAGRITTLFAGPKVGKSLLAVEAAAAIATGSLFLGRPCEAAPVVYVDQEMTADDLRERLRDLGYGPHTDLSQLHYYLLQSWPPLDTAAGGAQLLDVARAHRAAAVIVDTQSKVLSGPENDADTSAAYYRHTFLPLKRDGVAVLNLDHSGHDTTRTRGTSAKQAEVDMVWKLTTRDRDGLTLTRTHVRFRAGDDVVYLRREAQPLRHVTETVDDRAEQIIRVALDAIRLLNPPATASARSVAADLRAAGSKYRDETVREALRRHREETE